MKTCINVLQITVGGTEYTGVASFMLQYYKYIDKTKVHYDFLFCRENSMALQRENPVLKDSELYELNAIKKNGEMDYVQLLVKIYKILRRKRYDVVHINTSAIITTFVCLLAARFANVKKIIAHSHNDGVGRKITKSGKFTKRIKEICRRYVVKKCDWLFACSLNAGRFLFDDAVELAKFRIIRNAIDTEVYVYDEKIRDSIRNKECVKGNEIIIGHVGRMSPQKNHYFIVDVFNEFHRLHPSSKLWLVGDGEDKEKILNYIREKKLEKHVKIWGEQKNVSEIMQAMDVFVFPSNWEGFGLVAVEAQTSGLPVFASDRVPSEVDVTDLMHHISLSCSPITWAQMIVEYCDKQAERKSQNEKIREAGYDISDAANWLQEFYINQIN